MLECSDVLAPLALPDEMVLYSEDNVVTLQGEFLVNLVQIPMHDSIEEIRLLHSWMVREPQ